MPGRSFFRVRPDVDDLGDEVKPEAGAKAGGAPEQAGLITVVGIYAIKDSGEEAAESDD